MKKWLILLMLCLPFMTQAAERDDSKYLAGAVPEENGIVKFQQTFAVPGRSQADIYQVLFTYVNGIVEANKESQRTRFTMEDPAQGIMAARIEEWLEFKKKFLNWDRTRFRYQLVVKCENEKCHMEVTQISYYYREDMEGNNGETYRAEEWISDKAAINKKGTKLYPRSGKFRRKTVDRVAQIFEGAREAFEVPVPEAKRATQLITE